MRLLADENIQELTVLFLREHGYDICWIKEEGLASASDNLVFEHALQQGRSLLTYNADFVDLRELVGKEHHGIIRLRVSDQRITEMHPILKDALELIRNDNLANTLVTVSDSRTRMRNTFST